MWRNQYEPRTAYEGGFNLISLKKSCQLCIFASPHHLRPHMHTLSSFLLNMETKRNTPFPLLLSLLPIRMVITHYRSFKNGLWGPITTTPYMEHRPWLHGFLFSLFIFHSSLSFSSSPPILKYFVTHFYYGYNRTYQNEVLPSPSRVYNGESK